MASIDHGRAVLLPLLALCLSMSLAGRVAADEQRCNGEGASHAGHEMDPAMYDKLRERVDLYRSASKEEIDASMARMPQDYTAYLSDAGTKGKIGVLVLSHGYGKTGDFAFCHSLQPVALRYPTSVAFGMSMMQSSHVQQALDDLTAAGARSIVIVPGISSAASDDQLRQWQYMFGLTDNPGYTETPRVKTSAKVVWTPALEDHPLVVDAIADYAREKSLNPKQEAVILVSHGPTLDADNQRNLALLNRIAQKLKEKGGYSDVKAMSMQNDAPTEVRAANGRKLRAMVEDANRAGHRVIIVTNLQAPQSIQHQVEADIAGTQYVFNTKGLAQHPNYAKWVDAMVQDAARNL
jgi:hypothetical protein